MSDPRKSVFQADIGFRYLVDEEGEYALRDVSVAMSELAHQFDRTDIEEFTGSGIAALFRVFARATGNIAVSMAPAPKGFRVKAPEPAAR